MSAFELTNFWGVGFHDRPKMLRQRQPKGQPHMSLHNHIRALINTGQRLADLTSRARTCAVALEGELPSRPDTPVEMPKDVSGSVNINTQLAQVVGQYDEVVSLLAQQLDRIEMQVCEQPPQTSSLTGMTDERAYAGRSF